MSNVFSSTFRLLYMLYYLHEVIKERNDTRSILDGSVNMLAVTSLIPEKIKAEQPYSINNMLFMF